MARTIAELGAQLLRWLPSDYEAATDLLGAFAGMRTVELAADELEQLVTIQGATGIWLTLLARGYGVERASGESDASLRSRLRNIEDQLTRPAILAIVDELLDPYTSDPARMVEWFDEPYVDDNAWLDTALINGEPNTFLLVIPWLGDFAVGEFLDNDAWLDSELTAGSGPEPAIYATIIAEVERVRAAGVRWWLVLDETP